MSVGKEMLEELDSQAVAVKVEVCVSVPETVTCVAFTPGVWRSASEDYRAFRERPLTSRCICC